MPRLVINVDGEIDRLYALPPGDFVAARNALAARLKANDDRDAAARVKTLDKPNLPAGIVNQVFWTRRETFEALIHAADRFRSTQQSVLAGRATGADLQSAADAREAAIKAALAAVDALQADGEVTPAVRQRVRATLDAIAAYGSAKERPPAGRLTRDLDPPGFMALAALAAGAPAAVRPSAAARTSPEVDRPAPAKPTLVPAQNRASVQREARARESARAKTQALLAEAEKALAARRREATRASAAATAAAGRAASADEEVRQARRAFDDATDRATRAAEQLNRARTAAAVAAREVDESERAVDQARTQLSELSD